jgi:hypothetical protein
MKLSSVQSLRWGDIGNFGYVCRKDESHLHVSGCNTADHLASSHPLQGVVRFWLS